MGMLLDLFKWSLGFVRNNQGELSEMNVNVFFFWLQNECEWLVKVKSTSFFNLD